ncbi:MAG: hypothetical protein RBS43_02910 [Candidatus Cloacimonas sp.]|jgi:hypothetical protein|nr:hypothetical protein [Candidatus Cloacimonas sp.]
MKKDYSEVMETLKSLMPSLLQVAVYTTYEERCVVILEKDPPNILESLDALREYCHKRHLPFPLLISRDFVLSSLDSFPLEFLDIVSSNYTNLFDQEDILQNLKFSSADLRLQMEREIKSKWLLTRLAVSEQSQKPRALANVLVQSIRSLLPVLKGLCYISLKPIPFTQNEIIDSVMEITQLDLSFLLHWMSLDKADIFIIKNYLDLLSRFSEILEQMDK